MDLRFYPATPYSFQLMGKVSWLHAVPYYSSNHCHTHFIFASPECPEREQTLLQTRKSK